MAASKQQYSKDNAPDSRLPEPITEANTYNWVTNPIDA